MNKLKIFLRQSAVFLVYFMLSGILPANAQTGTVSGTVYQKDGVTPISDISISAFSEPCNEYEYSSLWMNTTSTDANGAYEFTDLSAGDIYIRANQWTFGSSHNTDYEGEWYGGGVSCNEAVPVTVTSGGNTANIDFTLEEGGSISGVVYENDGITPIEGLWVHAVSSLCGVFPDLIGSAYTDDSGGYVINGLHGGDVYIRVTNSGKNYIGQSFDNVIDCNEADSVTVVAGENTDNIDFRLNEGAIISGSVYESDEVTPVNGLIVYAYLEQCGETAIGSGHTNINGAYSIPGMPSEGVYLLASEDWFLNYNYLEEEWYNNAHSCDEADPVVAFTGEEIGNINFSLYHRTDDDSDEMPDDWEVETFGDMSRDGTGDYDSDGITDLDEYLAGTDPTVSDSIADNETDTQGDSGKSDGGGGCFITNVLHE